MVCSLIDRVWDAADGDRSATLERHPNPDRSGQQNKRLSVGDCLSDLPPSRLTGTVRDPTGEETYQVTGYGPHPTPGTGRGGLCRCRSKQGRSETWTGDS